MSSGRKPSLFAQKMEKMKEAKNKRRKTDIRDDLSSTFSVFGDKSYVVKGEEAELVHQENVAKLSSLSEEEILEMQKHLRQTLNPENIEFLKQKRKIEADIRLEMNTGLESSFNTLSTHEPYGIDLELKHKGVHMDVVEPEKMKWMEEVPSPNKILPNSLYNARFDFEGNLTPYIDENKSTCDKGLYNHGEEPQRPGYTVEELYMLSRSSMTGQRIMALNTLAAILEKEVILSNCLETELLKALLDSGLFFILRFSLDDRLRTVYLASLRAIGFLFWRALDMHYLSDMVGIFGDLRLPSFEINNETLQSENIEEIKDADLLKLDLVKGALRTDIVQRFRYIIDDPLIEVDHLLSIIKCLTRFSYHSSEATSVIMRTPSLLELLFANCNFPMKSSKMYIAKLMILFRVISCRSEHFAVELSSRLNIIPFLLKIIGDTVTKTSTSSQCIYLWQVLLYHGVKLESVTEFSPMFCSLLNQLFIVQAEDLKTPVIGYASALITLLIFLFERFYENVKFLTPIIERMCCQWISIFTNDNNVPREFIKLTSNIMYLLTNIPPFEVPAYHAQMKSFVNTSAYTRITEELKSCSFLLHSSKKNFVNSLPSLCVPMFILNTKNSLLMVHSMVKYNLLHGNASSSRDVLNNHVWSYIETLLEQSKLGEIANFWCTRYEISFLYDVVKLCSKWQVFIERKLLQLAFTLVRIVHTDDVRFVEDIFSKIIFNITVYEQIVMDYCDAANVFADLENMEQFFAKELNLPKTNVSLMSTKRGTECVLPTDWYYVPILKISNLNDSKAIIDTETIRPVLRWIHLIEYLSHEIKTDMTLSARYCRVCCVFFCGDVFLEVADLLHDILRALLKHNDILEFKKPIPGISSFYDFYRELCEQFASSSYCNPVFSMYILVPLQQKHDSELRRYVWTEQAVILRFLTLSVTQLLIPISCYLEPCEKNLTLVETYLRMIATGSVREKTSPVMYLIGLHHVATFVKKFKEETVAQKMKKMIESIGNEDLRSKFLNYVYED